LKFFHAHHSKRRSLNQRRVAAIRQAIPATTDGAVVTASVLRVHALFEQIRCLVDAIRGFDRQIGALTRTHSRLARALDGAVHRPRWVNRLCRRR
jgi:hypothetical protein